MPVTADPRGDPEGVPLGLLHRYLLAQRWLRTPDHALRRAAIEARASGALLGARANATRAFDAYLLSEKGYDDIELIVPTNPTATDFKRRMRDVLQTLADIEGRDVPDVIFDVKSMGYDVLLAKVPDAFVVNDTIDLGLASAYVDGSRRMLTATANTELAPVPYFLRARKEALEYSGKCRFGHTFRGSFGFTIESPITPNQDPVFDISEQEPPFERRVIQRFARGLLRVGEAAQQDDADSLYQGYKTGFSANSLEQLASLVESTTKSTLLFEVAFSREWKASPELPSATTWEVGLKEVEIAKFAAKEMRRREPMPDQRIFGRVIRLETDGDPSDILSPDQDRAIDVAWESPDLGTIFVRVVLPAVDYLEAIDAHRNGRPIGLSGTLELIGRRWYLTSPTEFAVGR